MKLIAKKILKILLILISSFFTIGLHAELKPKGTVQNYICGAGKSFPMTTSVCLANVVESTNEYLVVNSYNSEILLPVSEIFYKLDHAVFALIKNVEWIDNKTIFTAYAAQVNSNGAYSLQTEYTLIVEDDSLGQMIGSLSINGEPVYGSEKIPMTALYHTERN